MFGQFNASLMEKKVLIKKHTDPKLSHNIYKINNGDLKSGEKKIIIWISKLNLKPEIPRN